MAKTKAVAKKKAVTAPKKGAVKPAAKPKPKAGKTKAAAKPAAKPVAASRKLVAKPAAKPAARKPGSAKPIAKPAIKVAAKAVVAAPVKKAAPKRPVAVSHRPQKTAAVSVQPKPAPPKPASPAPVSRARPVTPGSVNGQLSEDLIRRAPESAYMNEEQLSFFNERLLQMRSEVLAREVDVKERLHQREVFADPADRASAEEEHWLDLRLRERESLLLKKIDDALRRIRDRDYGYCEKTGEPIGIARLLARPTATVCVDIKGQDERAESQYRDR